MLAKCRSADTNSSLPIFELLCRRPLKDHLQWLSNRSRRALPCLHSAAILLHGAQIHQLTRLRRLHWFRNSAIWRSVCILRQVWRLTIVIDHLCSCKHHCYNSTTLAQSHHQVPPPLFAEEIVGAVMLCRLPHHLDLFISASIIVSHSSKTCPDFAFYPFRFGLWQATEYQSTWLARIRGLGGWGRAAAPRCRTPIASRFHPLEKHRCRSPWPRRVAMLWWDKLATTTFVSHCRTRRPKLAERCQKIFGICLLLPWTQ